MPAPWFFLSYARADGVYLMRFFTDVAMQVRSKDESLGGLDLTEIGFMDRGSTEPGDFWDPALLDALHSTQILVCALSRGYLASEYCGKEFGVFHARLQKYGTQLPPGSRPRLIMPVFWHPKNKLPELPEAIQKIQYDHSDFGDLYLEKGLFTLSNQRRYRDEYNQFIDAFTWRLVDAVREHRLPPAQLGTLALADSMNVFREAGKRTVELQRSGPTSIRFVFVAGRTDELREVRDHVEAYGTEYGRQWCPFTPDTATVGAVCSLAASDENLFPEDLLVDADITHRIREAETANAVVLLIVDPWSARLPRFREFLEGYDQKSFLNTGVIVLWNLSDQDTCHHESALRTSLKRKYSEIV